MTSGTLVVNAALIAILLPGIVQLARQIRPIDDYYDEETYYDEKAVDGAADFSEDLTFAQYDLGVTQRVTPLPALRQEAECRRLPEGLHHKAWRQRWSFTAWTTNIDNRTATSPFAKKDSTTSESTPITPAKPGTRRVHVAKQQDVSTPTTTERVRTTTTKSARYQIPAPSINITGVCRVVHSEAWRQVTLHADCLQMSDVKRTEHRVGELYFIRQFRIASETTHLLWHYMVKYVTKSNRSTDCQDCRLSTVKTTGLCSRTLENSKVVIQILRSKDLPAGEPAHSWHLVCRLVKEYKFCVSEMMTDCNVIKVERKPHVPMKAKTVSFTFSYARSASIFSTSALWASASGNLALWCLALWMP